jgi:broad specificity phosphatase PhoE
LAEALAPWQPGRIVSSPLRRAVQTATAIGRRVGVAVVVEPRLIDRDYGRWAGYPAAEVIGRFGSLGGAPDVESVHALRYRAEMSLDQQLPSLGARPVVLVSHDILIRELLAALDPELGPADWIGQRTACFNELVHDTGRWRVLQVDQKPTPAAVSR